MKLGLGLYRHMLDAEHFRFARQCGATHIVAHLVDYFPDRSGGSGSDDQPIDGDRGWGRAGDPDKLWSLDELVALRKTVEAEGLVLEAVENFDPAHWHDVLFDGPQRDRHIENCQTTIRRLGEAAIPIMGYNFSLAGVAGRISGPLARGGAESVGVDGSDNRPLPNSMAWNMVVDSNAEGTREPVTHEQLWDRLGRFLDDILPVAGEAGVTMAAHPDDPPFESVRSTPRLVHQPSLYQKLIDRHPNPANQLEFCIGTLAEMSGEHTLPACPDPHPADRNSETHFSSIYETVDHYSRQDRLAYVHLRNVHGKVPNYHETFLDDGDVDMHRVLSILKNNGFDGVIIPDHTPRLTCAAPWHAGMAWALGWIRAAIDRL